MELKNYLTREMKSFYDRFISEYEESPLQTKTFNQRINEANKIINRYKDRIPVIIIPHKKLELKKKKYLVPKGVVVGQLVYTMRRYVTFEHTQAMYLFTENGTMPLTSGLIDSLYYYHKNNDGFLYLYATIEHTFG